MSRAACRGFRIRWGADGTYSLIFYRNIRHHGDYSVVFREYFPLYGLLRCRGGFTPPTLVRGYPP
ncbi:hypothetical protein HMPREF0742_00875 [Rothia aeria F0184]|uniref:Uncharacterized protein n=1 Tax=Rothia aeria F0184 TaxID=888019 RepID=U7V798_9MICC|nr:hypothetical protein HMPREF0742_00875 [Rothia aeria F0184]